MIYYRLFPFGDERDDWRMGTIAAAVLAPHTKNPKPKAKDFMLPMPQTQEQKEAGLKAALRRAGKGKGRK